MGSHGIGKAIRNGVGMGVMALIATGLGAGAATAQPDPAALAPSLDGILANSKVGDRLDAPLAPTGDALFDRYAAEMMQRIEDAPAVTLINLVGNMMNGAEPPVPIEAGLFQPALLPDEVLAQWEQEFGNDVRYWELRYFCAQQLAIYPWQEAPPASVKPDMQAEDFLREAKRRGLATWNTLMLLYFYDRNAITDQADAKLAALGDDSATGYAGTAEIMAWEEQAELALLNEAVAAGLDQAWPYFMRAQYYANLGEWDLALADLATGCENPNAQNPAPFPVGYVQEGVLLGQPRGNVVVSGAITQGAFSLPLFNYIKFKEMAKEVVAITSWGGDPVYLERIHQFGCRLAEGMPFSLIQALVGQVVAQICFTHIETDEVIALTPDQLDTLRRAHMVSNEFRQDVRQQTQSVSAVLETTPATLDEKLGPHGQWIAAYLAEEAYLRLYYASLEPKLELLRQVHIPELKAPEGLQHYEPLVPEVADESGG